MVNGICALLIVALVAFIFFVQRRHNQVPVKQSPQSDLAQMTFQSKVFLGVKVITEDNPLLEEQQGQPPLKFGYFGSVRMRQAGAIMTSELKSSEDALVVMTSLEDTAERSSAPSKGGAG